MTTVPTQQPDSPEVATEHPVHPAQLKPTTSRLASLNKRNFEVQHFAEQWLQKLENASSLQEIKKLFRPLYANKKHDDLRLQLIDRVREAAVDFAKTCILDNPRETEAFMFGYSGLSFVPSNVLGRIFQFVNNARYLVKMAAACSRFKRIIYDPTYNCFGDLQIIFESIGGRSFDIEFYEQENIVRMHAQKMPPNFKVRKHDHTFRGFPGDIPVSLNALIGNAKTVTVMEEQYIAKPLACEIMRHAETLRIEYNPKDLTQSDQRYGPKESFVRTPIPKMVFPNCRYLSMNVALLKDLEKMILEERGGLRLMFPVLERLDLIMRCRTEYTPVRGALGYLRSSRVRCECIREMSDVNWDLWEDFLGFDHETGGDRSKEEKNRKSHIHIMGEFCVVAQQTLAPRFGRFYGLDLSRINVREITDRGIQLPPVKYLRIPFDSMIQNNFNLNDVYQTVSDLEIEVKLKNFDRPPLYNYFDLTKVFDLLKNFVVVRKIVFQFRPKFLNVDALARGIETYMKEKKNVVGGDGDNGVAMYRDVEVVLNWWFVQRKRYHSDWRTKKICELTRSDLKTYEKTKENWLNALVDYGFDPCKVRIEVASDLLLKFKEDPFMENILWSD